MDYEVLSLGENQFKLSNTAGVNELSILDMMGKEVMKINAPDIFNLNHLPKAVYIVQFTANEEMMTKKLIVK
jgi:hypothetical protein